MILKWLALAVLCGLGIALYLWKKRVSTLKQFSISHMSSFIPERFSVQILKVKTDDGYILQLFNVRSKTHFNPHLNPVLLQHGLGSSAASYLICEFQSPAFVLADLGCDVYLANNRGTVYSLTHEKFTVKNKEFWDFSFQDMALD